MAGLSVELVLMEVVLRDDASTSAADVLPLSPHAAAMSPRERAAAADWIRMSGTTRRAPPPFLQSCEGCPSA